MNKINIKKVTSFLFEFKLPLILAFLCAIFAVLCNVYAPMLVGNVLDALTNQASLNRMIGMLVLVYVGYSFFTWMMMLLCNKIAFSSSCRLRVMLYDKMNHLPISFFDTHAHGDIISRYVNDVDLVSDGLIQSLSTLLSGIVTIIASVVLMMMMMNVIMSLVVMVCAPFTYFVAKNITIRNHHYFRQQAKEVGALNAYSEEMIDGIHTIKTFHQEKQVFEQFQESNMRLYECGVKSQFYGSLVNPSTRLVTNLGYAVVGFVAILMGMNQMISIGEISSFLIYSTLFAKPFNEITSVLTQLQSALASSERLFSILEEVEEIQSQKQGQIQTKGQIRFEDVSFSYTKDVPLITHLNLDVPAGSQVAIVGKTGAGKTTLVNLLMRFYDLNSGTIYLDGQDYSYLSKDEVRRCFGMVLQDTYLFEDTIAANIAYGKPNATKEEIIEAAKKSGAHAFIRRMECGYDTILHSDHALSLGQMQLLSITRVLLMNPSILILDEATSNIDTRSEQLISSAMQLLMKEKTSFIIAHRLSTIIHADMILVMDKGNIIEIGTHEELLERKGAYYELYHAQFA